MNRSGPTSRDFLEVGLFTLTRSSSLRALATADTSLARRGSQWLSGSSIDGGDRQGQVR